MKSILLPLFLISCCLLPVAASAQVDNNVQAPPPGDAAAQLEVRLSAIEEDLRQLRGKVEENDFQVRKLSDNQEKMQKDIDFRLNELSGNKPAAGVPVAPDMKSDGTNPATTSERHVIPGNPGTPDAATTAGDGTLKMPDSGEGTKTSFSTPREHYNYAFRLLNQTQYEEAAQAFASFAQKYPKDPLIGNAYYWEGETFYIRRDYAHAADNFRQGYEALPEGPKAADNLLKLAMSLDALGRSKEACVVLQQISVKFNKNSTNVIDKAYQEQKRIGCQ